MIYPLSDSLKAAVLATAKLILHQHRLHPRNTLEENAEDVVSAATAAAATTTSAKTKLQISTKRRKAESELPSSSTFLVSLKDL